MKNCLVTNLLGTVSDDSILRVGEMKLSYNRVSQPTSKTQSFSIKFSKETTLRIVGNGYFTDSTLSNNLGKELTIQENFLTDVYSSNGDYDIIIPNKYSLVQFCLYPNAASNSYEDRSNKAISISDFIGMKDLSYLSLSSAKVTGDIAALESSIGFTYLNLYGSGVTGDIKVLADKTALSYVSLPEVTGDISSLKDLSALKYLSLYGVSGDINTLKNLSDLQQITLAAGEVYGDLAVLSSKCYFASFSKNNISKSFSWSSRPSSYNIMALEGPVKLVDVDKALQDLANCVKAVPSSNQVWYRTISILGTRTSASDDAVATLQGNGYTVSVTPV